MVASTAVFGQTLGGVVEQGLDAFGVKKPAPAAAAGPKAAAPGPNPVCVSAWNALSNAKQTANVKILKETQCAIIYKNGWLTAGTGVENNAVCAKPWNDLAAAKMESSGKNLVSNNCAIMVKSGWKPNP